MKRMGKWIVLLLIAVQSVLAFATIYMMVYKEGVGLYLALQRGSENRGGFEVAVCVCTMAILLVILVVPCVLLKHRSGESLFRFSSVYFAFMPTLSMGMLVHLFDGHNLLAVVYDTERMLTLFASYIRVVIPLLILLYVLYRGDDFGVKKWHRVLLVIQVPVYVAMVMLPEMSDVLWFLCFYLLAVVAFDWWEKVCVTNKTTGDKVMMWLFFLLMYLRGSTRMINMLVHYVTKG